MKLLWRGAAASLFFLAALQAQAAINTWKATLSGGTYEVALSAITAVSVHEYVIENGVHITELAIDTTGNTEARFYYMQTLAQAEASSTGGPAQSLYSAAQERAQSAADRATSRITGGAANDAMTTLVVKNYPTTTHAHTVEYRLSSLGEINDLFQSVEGAWKNSTNTTYTSPTASTSSPSSSGGSSSGQ